MAQVQIGGQGYPSFDTVANADVYLGGDVQRAAGWALRNADAKARGMVSATRQLLTIPWCGDPPGIDTAPEVVKQVTAMLAADLLAKPKLFSDASGNSNIKSARAGSAAVEFFRPTVNSPPLPRALWTMLVEAGVAGCLPESLSTAPYISGGPDCAAPGARFDHEPYWTRC